jgi:hypothetical protein
MASYTRDRGEYVECIIPFVWQKGANALKVLESAPRKLALFGRFEVRRAEAGPLSIAKNA